MSMPYIAISRNSMQTIYLQVLLGSFALFLIAGNFFRFLTLPFFPSAFSLAEGILYCLTAPLYFSSFKKSFLILFCIALSTLYGTLLHGIDTTSILFSVKLIAMLATGVAIGDALFMKFSCDLEQCLRYLLKIFSGVLLLGTLILLFFSDARMFFYFLEDYGIHFFGDPHQKRFISPFFDPNYYSAIACIPLLCCWFMRKKSFWYFVLSGAFFLSILLSWSRSGIATCFMMIAFLSIKPLLNLRTLSFSLYRWMGIGLFSFLFGATLFICSQEWQIFYNRLIHFSDELSAYSRLISFQEGLPYFLQRPFFGVGYNYLSSSLYENAGILSLDSSLLITLINFGLIPFLALLFMGATWSIRRFKRKDQLFSGLYIYLLICILFTCQFNNLLYYQYWLIPMIALFTYLDRSNENSSRS